MTAGDVAGTREMLRRRDVSVVEHVQEVLAFLRKGDAVLNAFVSVAHDDALRAAEAADQLVRRLGSAAWDERPLLGVTVAVKDLVQTRDLPTTRGSLLPNPRARADAPAVARLRAAGAIVVGKTATSEYGWSAATVGRLAPPTRNPWAAELSAGGSSGGSAAAVAAGLCSAAIGTDGAGSIRIPAAFCGVVGFKPSFARIPYVPPCADRLAHLGPLTRTVRDAAELTGIMAGAHPADPDSAASVAPAPRMPGPLRIGWIEFPGTAGEVRRVTEAAWPALAAAGHRIERVEVPFPDPYPALVDILASAEAAGVGPEDEERGDPGRLAVARHGRTVSGASVIRAEETRLALRVAMAAVMDRYDLLAMATVPIEPFDAHEIGPSWAARPEDLLWLAWSPAAYPFNLTGQPALTLPAGLTRSGLPVGLQLVGRVRADDLVLEAGRELEAELGPLPNPPVHVAERTL